MSKEYVIPKRSKNAISTAYEENLEKITDSLNFFNKKDFELFGTYSYDFTDISAELRYIKEEYKLESGYCTSDETEFKRINRAYENEQAFAREYLFDYFRDKAMRRLDPNDWKTVYRHLKATVPDTVAVELRLYPTTKGRYKVYFVHAIDWKQVERQIIPVMEKLKFHDPDPITKF